MNQQKKVFDLTDEGVVELKLPDIEIPELPTEPKKLTVVELAKKFGELRGPPNRQFLREVLGQAIGIEPRNERRYRDDELCPHCGKSRSLPFCDAYPQITMVIR